MEKTQDGTAALPVRQFTPEELAVFYQNLQPTPRPALPMSMHSPNQLKVMRARNQMNRAAGLPDQFEFDEVADTVLFHPEFSSRDLEKDSLDGAQAFSTSEVGSADDFPEKNEGNTDDVPDHNAQSPRSQAEDAKENGDSAQDAIGAEEEEESESEDDSADERSYQLELEKKFEQGVLTFDEKADRAAFYVYSRVSPPVKVPPGIIFSCKAQNQECKARGFSDRWLIKEAAGIVQSLTSRPLNPLDGTQASGSADEFTEDNTNYTPVGVPAGSSSDDDTSTTDDDSSTSDDGTPPGSPLSMNATEVEGVVAEKRKSNAEVETTISLSPKKARIEGTEELTDAPINSNSVKAVVV